MKNGITNSGENKEQNLLNESVLSEINLSVLSNLNDSKANIENMNINLNFNLNNYGNEQLYISKDQYCCTQCELPPEILYDTDETDTIKIKCEKHGTKTFLISDYLQIMSKNTYHYYKCGLCKKNSQRNFEGQTFKYCYHCKRILCPKCFMQHKSYRDHKKIFFANEVNIRCEKHLGDKYDMYCYDCDKSICKKCSEKQHKNHFIISLKELNPSRNAIEKINTTIDNLKQELNNLFKKAEYIKNVILLNELILFTYEKYQNNYHHIINISNLYKSLSSPNKNENIICNILDCKDIITPIPPKPRQDLAITRFELNIAYKMPKTISDPLNNFSSKTIIAKSKQKRRYEVANSLKPLKKDKNISKFNKKFNLNITPDNGQILLSHLKLDDDDFKVLCSFNLPNLSKLCLSENNISNIDPLLHIKSNKLEELYLDNNNLTNIEVFKNANINSLKQLILYCNKISTIDVLSGLTFANLTQLNLYNNKVSNIDSLSKIYMPKLQVLHLGFNKISNIDVLAQVQFPELISLNLNRNEISSIDVLEKVHFEKLEKLDFFDNNISNIDILSKVYFPFLKDLNFWINNIQNIESLCKADFPKLEKINLSNNNISDISNIIGFHFPSLKELNFQYNKIDTQNEKNKNVLNEIQKKITILKY